jgi:hemolysin III
VAGPPRARQAHNDPSGLRPPQWRGNIGGLSIAKVAMFSSATRPLPPYRNYSNAELIADGAVHAAALVAGVIAFSVLFQKVAMHGRLSDGVAMAVYAAGFFLLFGFSCAYNMAPPSATKRLLRRFDLASIYLMIGGTYTALLSQARYAPWVVALVAAVWTGALAGASIKLFLPGRFDRHAILLYLALGWSALIAVKPLVSALPAGTLALVFAGGAIYCVGVVFHRWESLKFQNAIWHTCVTAAAACHFAGVLQAVGR